MSGTVARGGPGRGRREVVEEAREDIRESTTTTNPTTRRRRRRRGRFKILSFVRPEVGLENSIWTSGRSRRTRSRRRSSQPSSVNRRRSILHIRSWTHSKTRAPPQPQREREFRTILIRPLDTKKNYSDLWTQKGYLTDDDVAKKNRRRERRRRRDRRKT